MEKNINVRKALEEDNSKLIEFHQKFPLLSHGEIIIDRCKNYFTPYDIQSEQHCTYLLEVDELLSGKVSFIIQDVWLENKVRPVAFGRDLRISNDRHAILQWGKHFVPVVEEVFHNFGVKNLFSILSLNEVKALNTFTRPRSDRRGLPRYHLFRRFNLVSIHGRLPWVGQKLPHVRVKKVSEHHLDSLIYYICQKSLSRNLSSVWDSDSFLAKLKRWKNLKLEDFYIAVDQNDNIIGCMAPWSSEGIQELIPVEYNLRTQNFSQFLKIGRLMGWTQKLSPPMSETQLPTPMHFQYLNFLFADNEDIFERLLWTAYEDLPSNHFLIYTQMRSEILYRRPQGWITTYLPYGVYYINLPGKEPPTFIHPSQEIPVELEPFFVI